jgi:hypothetical protein
MSISILKKSVSKSKSQSAQKNQSAKFSLSWQPSLFLIIFAVLDVAVL